MLDVTPFAPRDWYWLASDGRVYASARQQVVDAQDPEFAAWSAASRPTPWPRDNSGEQTDTALQDVLTAYGLWVDLVAYAADKRWRVETGGITVGGVPVATDRESQGLITGAHAYVQINPGVTIKYKSGTGFIDLDAATVTAVATAVAAHVQACFAAEADVAAAIQRGDILTLGEVDAWPWP